MRSPFRRVNTIPFHRRMSICSSSRQKEPCLEHWVIQEFWHLGLVSCLFSSSPTGPKHTPSSASRIPAHLLFLAIFTGRFRQQIPRLLVYVYAVSFVPVKRISALPGASHHAVCRLSSMELKECGLHFSPRYASNGAVLPGYFFFCLNSYRFFSPPLS